MSVQEPIPPTSSVTALRIPIIKKGEYDLWSMKMRQHLLSFHDATNAKTLWTAIKARFGGNEASKKMQKNLLKQQFETFTIGSREELDSAYERFQHILSMLELYDATVSLEDANLKFLRSLPSVWHVVATMIRGQPGLDELEFDDLYNNLKVYELELKGVSNSNSQNIAFLSTEVKGSTLKQSTAEPAHIPKGYTQAISSKVPTAPNCHFARECRFAKYQENRANGRNEKRIVAIEDSNSKACMMSIELMQSTWHFDKMTGLVDFDWSNKVDDALVSLALMATNSEMSLEVRLKKHEKNNEYAWGDKYEQMEYDLKARDFKLEEKQKELDQVLKERDDFKVKLEKWTNASVLQNEVLNKQRYLSDKSCIGFGVESSSSENSDNSSGNTNSTESLYPNFQKAKGFHAVPPPTGTVIPPRANVSFTGIDELAIRNKVVNQENTKSSQPEIDRNKVIIEDWVDSDDEETDLNFSEIQKKTVVNSENSETSFENRSPNSQTSVGQGSRKKGLGHKRGKTCFVCYSPDHLIKDCDLHERTFKQTQTHKPKGTQGSRDTRPVWNNINRVNHSNFSGNSRYPHQKRSFIPSAVLTREGLKSTARPKMTQTISSKNTAHVFYQGTARPAVLSQSTGRPYYPRMDNIRPRTSSFSPSKRFSTTRTPHRPQRPKKIMKSIWVKKVSTVGSQAVLPQNVSVKGSAMINPTQTWRPKGAYLDSVNRDNGSYTLKQFEYGNPEEDLKDYAIIDSGCSGSMTGDKDKLSDFKEFKGGYVAFGNDPKGGRITGKGTIKTSCIDFEKVSYVEELKFNLLSVSQICDKKHNVLFTDKECLILSPKFKFVDEDLVILRAPRKNDVYSLDLKNIIPSGGVTCLVAKATKDEAVLWHRRLGHVNFKNINKLVKGNLVRGLPSKTFKLDHSCLACRKGKQHRASCKKIEERTVREPLELLHMDLFGPVSVESVNRKKYCLVVTDDCSKFSWVFFLAYKDETYDMLHDLIVGLENKLRHKVKTIRCDHGTEFKNHLMNEFCAKKGIKREYSIARTPQQNGVAERKNRTLIEAARTMLADSLLPIQFWAEAVNTACYVLNRVLVTKPQMKTPYEILMGRSPNISFMRPFGCPLTILNTLDQLGKFDGKSEEGYLLGYSTSSKGFRVYNRVTRKVQDCLHVDFLENQENQNKGKAQPMPPEEHVSVAKKLDCPLKIKLLHDELVSLMHQGISCKAHNDVHGMSFEEEKSEKYLLQREKNMLTVTFTLVLLNNPPKILAINLQIDDDTTTSWCFLYKLFCMLRKAETAWGVQTGESFKTSTSKSTQALLERPKNVSQALQMKVGLSDARRELFNSSYKREEVYVKQPPGLKDPCFIQTMVIQSCQGHLVWPCIMPKEHVVYVDDIIFGSTKSSMVKDFEDLMQKEFKMSSMGELIFFLGLQVKQSNGGIFLSQDKYVKDIPHKFDFRTIKPTSTPIEAHKSLGKDVDVHLYRSMIGCLMYLTASRPDIMFAVCLCARFQVTPKVSHLHAVKRIFSFFR
ncbi:putative ribonuclease H-like domain-containing protein [Tanacetum coccineum]